MSAVRHGGIGDVFFGTTICMRAMPHIHMPRVGNKRIRQTATREQGVA